MLSEQQIALLKKFLGGSAPRPWPQIVQLFDGLDAAAVQELLESNAPLLSGYLGASIEEKQEEGSAALIRALGLVPAQTIADAGTIAAVAIAALTNAAALELSRSIGAPRLAAAINTLCVNGGSVWLVTNAASALAALEIAGRHAAVNSALDGLCLALAGKQAHFCHYQTACSLLASATEQNAPLTDVNMKVKAIAEAGPKFYHMLMDWHAPLKCLVELVEVLVRQKPPEPAAASIPGERFLITALFRMLWHNEDVLYPMYRRNDDAFAALRLLGPENVARAAVRYFMPDPADRAAIERLGEFDRWPSGTLACYSGALSSSAELLSHGRRAASASIAAGDIIGYCRRIWKAAPSRDRRPAWPLNAFRALGWTALPVLFEELFGFSERGISDWQHEAHRLIPVLLNSCKASQAQPYLVELLAHLLSGDWHCCFAASCIMQELSPERRVQLALLVLNRLESDEALTEKQRTLLLCRLAPHSMLELHELTSDRAIDQALSAQHTHSQELKNAAWCVLRRMLAAILTHTWQGFVGPTSHKRGPEIAEGVVAGICEAHGKELEERLASLRNSTEDHRTAVSLAVLKMALAHPDSAGLRKLIDEIHRWTGSGYWGKPILGLNTGWECYVQQALLSNDDEIAGMAAYAFPFLALHAPPEVRAALVSWLEVQRASSPMIASLADAAVGLVVHAPSLAAPHDWCVEALLASELQPDQKVRFLSQICAGDVPRFSRLFRTLSAKDAAGLQYCFTSSGGVSQEHLAVMLAAA